MGLDLSENGHGFNQLFEHVGHEVVVETYGEQSPSRPVNVAIECITCCAVLLDFDSPDML